MFFPLLDLGLDGPEYNFGREGPSLDSLPLPLCLPPTWCAPSALAPHPDRLCLSPFSQTPLHTVVSQPGVQRKAAQMN